MLMVYDIATRWLSIQWLGAQLPVAIEHVTILKLTL